MDPNEEAFIVYIASLTPKPLIDLARKDQIALWTLKSLLALSQPSIQIMLMFRRQFLFEIISCSTF